ncbi:MAG: hypothetical protein LUC88_00520 [Prevotella sp.]|nr:hypothetical protein [Prevotella sp.]
MNYDYVYIKVIIILFVSPDITSEDDAITSFSEITVTIEGTDDVNIDSDKLSNITLNSPAITGLGRISVSANNPTTDNGNTIYTLTLSSQLQEKVLFITLSQTASLQWAMP